jgi:mannose-6-phosphate isomerase
MRTEPFLTAPVCFEPLYMERVWGGRAFESLYRRRLPRPGVPYGESWEVVDRPNEQSVVRSGLMPGMPLHQLWKELRVELFGRRGYRRNDEHFPLLLKILDAREQLSLQVHPPAAVAARLGGEPKTEMWFVAHAAPGAELFAGLKRGVTRARFEEALGNGGVADLVHRIPVQAGDFIFIPSGRVHAIGGGIVVFEVQQNSDTTFRVFDWNRTGLDGRPRPLHIAESLECIDFDDFEPSAMRSRPGILVDCEPFRVVRWDLSAGESKPAGGFCVVAVISGRLGFAGETFGSGDFFLVPDGARGRVLFEAQEATVFLTVGLPSA